MDILFDELEVEKTLNDCLSGFGKETFPLPQFRQNLTGDFVLLRYLQDRPLINLRFKEPQTHEDSPSRFVRHLPCRHPNGTAFIWQS
jgi:hypothetical protein